MNDQDDAPGTGSSTTAWSTDGIATLEATASTTRATIEAGLRAVLTLAVAPALDSSDTGRSAPIHGEGDDLASLFADMAEDLLGQIELYGGGLHDVVVDGVLRREGAGYVGWGYASVTLDAATSGDVPRLLGTPTVNADGIRGIVLRASLQR